MECSGPEQEGSSGCRSKFGRGFQSNLLPRWQWFTDYNNPSNRIWLAWNDEFIDVDIVDIGVQFIHCRILIRSMHTSVMVTVAYGDNEIGARRDLWQALCTMAGLIGQEPWLVGGDFNAVRDLSEVCGTSGDIQLAMHEFNECILRAGLIALPMKGNVWRHQIIGTPMYSVTKKLKALKPVFRQQRKEKGDISLNVKLAAEFWKSHSTFLWRDTTSPSPTFGKLLQDGVTQSHKT
ncbi:UNVERIFIED_CONTAM: hypothetical protein Sangu_3074100 [Sesamum angustifolium]|uniref:Endonuclease/exonuclease/phosphatase domain-containing protein n=1 Tax=Sesamum angustifolium TaxID=2727405 RepID=A0AAW2KDQ9_9LAMI